MLTAKVSFDQKIRLIYCFTKNDKNGKNDKIDKNNK